VFAFFLVAGCSANVLALKKMLSCAKCSFATGNVKKYVVHYRIHSHIPNFQFPCSIDGCISSFGSYAAFRRHAYRQHILNMKSRSNFSDILIQLKCPVPFCESSHVGIDNLLTHIKGHLRLGARVQCPFEKCGKFFNKLSSFTAHISRLHKDISKEMVCAGYLLEIPAVVSDSISANMPAPVENTDVDNMTGPVVADAIDSDSGDDLSSDDSKNNYTAVVSRFYLMLQSKLHVPSSTVQKIVEQMSVIHDLDHEHMMQKLHQILLANGLNSDQAGKIVENLCQHDMFKSLHDHQTGLLRSAYSRKQFFMSKFPFVSAIPVRLGVDNSSKVVGYHYVPIKETLKVMLQDPSVWAQLTNPLPVVDGVLQDLQDGVVHKNNNFFTDNKTTLKVILYQDSFEVVNPIGAARKKHKLLGVYFTLANLYPWNRSSVDQLQLVLLCKEVDCKMFKPASVFGQLIDDLKQLETSGIDVDGTTVFGSIMCIAGDNLGCHFIGGFVENFSTTSHFCRYCLLTRSEFDCNSFADTGAARTANSYCEAVQQLQNDSNLTVCEGIKENSIFNDLMHFHVCLPGLPPCLGHDLFEGVIAYDMALYIRYFVKSQKWFTYDAFDHRIKTFKYAGSDALDKPGTVTVDGKRLSGNAIQNWCFIRLFPLVMAPTIQDTRNEVWLLVLLLIRITGLICAPKLSFGQVACMKLLIDEYLEGRSRLFPDTKLRPKHHFLLHYPVLTLKFGPLLRVWTMRFEAKHSYFKRCVRSCQNFSNVTGMLAERHQLLQAYFASGTLFSHKTFAVNNTNPFTANIYSQEIKDAVAGSCVHQSRTVVSDRCTFKGTEFRSGCFLVIKPTSDGEIAVAELLLVLIDDETELFFIVRTCRVQNETEVAAIKIIDREGMIICQKPQLLLTHEHPLPLYSVRNDNFLVLKYAPFDNL
jgi:hypothetical protein